MVMTCFVSGCGAISFRDCGISFYSFPADLEICTEWENAIVAGTNQTNMARRSKHSKVCSNHFAIQSFRTDVSTTRYPKLIANAIPSIFIKKESNNKRRLPSRNTLDKNQTGSISNHQKLILPNEILKIIGGVEDDDDKNEHDEYGWTCSSSSAILPSTTRRPIDQPYMMNRMPNLVGNLNKINNTVIRQGKQIINLEDRAYRLEQRLKKVEITFKFDN